MILLDGKYVADQIQKKLTTEIKSLLDQHIHPKLTVILVGNDVASEMYVKMKQKQCQLLNIQSQCIRFTDTVQQSQIIHQIEILNQDTSIHGILIQLPLPKHLNTDGIMNTIDPYKDVDGFHTLNAGKLMLNQDYLFLPCTPKGCIELLDFYQIDVKGMNIVIIGCSSIVGLPLSLLLLHRGATITICHIDTRDTKQHTLNADMVVACCGVPHLLKKDWIRENTILIDIGIHKQNHKTIGDIDFEDVKEKASYITPVPGGIGPMTIAMLMKQTVKAAAQYSIYSI
tara:strand:- start:60 stop:914 length:855 start_codon:yes stop_codon:yes gene_type:complete